MGNLCLERLSHEKEGCDEKLFILNNLFNEKVLLAHSDLVIPETEWIKPCHHAP